MLTSDGRRCPDGQKLKLPPVLLGHLREDPKKKMLLLNGHLDVQPVLKEDGWDYEPFVISYILYFLSDTPHHYHHHHHHHRPHLFLISVEGGQGQAVREGFDRRQGSRHRLEPHHRMLPCLWEDFCKDVGTGKLIHGTDKVMTLMARWRFPSLSLHGIEGAFAEPGGKPGHAV